MNRFLRDAIELLRIRSYPEYGNEEVVSFFEKLFQERGIFFETQKVFHSEENISKRQFNLKGCIGDSLVDRSTRKGLLFLSHLDTYEPVLPKQWTEIEAPLKGEIKNNHLVGLGASSGKLDFLCKLYAAQKFREQKLKIPLYLVGVCGRELRDLGAQYLVESLAVNPQWVVVGAPTQLELVHRQKSMIRFEMKVDFHSVVKDSRGYNRQVRVTSFGKSGAHSFSNQGENAIEQLFSFLEKAENSGFEFQLKEMKTPYYDRQIPDRADAELYLTSHQFEDFKRFFREFDSLPEMKGKFELEFGGLGDLGIQFIPEQVKEFTFEFRKYLSNLQKQLEREKISGFDPDFSTLSFQSADTDAYQVKFGFHLHSFSKDGPQVDKKKVIDFFESLKKSHPNLNIQINVPSISPQIDENPEDDLYQIASESLEAIGLVPTVSSLSYTTEAGFFAEKGFSTLVFGPGEAKGNLYAPDEKVTLHELQKAVHFYQELIEGICL
ncbi:MAG: hypothetical protein CL678_04225 [Bdellovibrionaceae bacterium]|nr:hypothetical protein [Pseudobdellovibrionaceae bacterium]|tara:strand:- start:1100 stop:2578 length:1479 start_codon:yes stop_codon:yes gene_type:complete